MVRVTGDALTQAMCPSVPCPRKSPSQVLDRVRDIADSGSLKVSRQRHLDCPGPVIRKQGCAGEPGLDRAEHAVRMSVPVEVLVSTRVKDSHDEGRGHMDT